MDTVTLQYLPVSVVLDPGYDRFGNRNTLDFHEGGVSIPHSWTYGFRDRLTSATLGGPAPQFTYYDNDQLHTIDHGNAVTSTYGYKPQGPVSSIDVSAGGSSLHLLDYTSYDATDAVKTIEESIGGSLAGSYVYDYDGAARLKNATYPMGLPRPTSSTPPGGVAMRRRGCTTTGSGTTTPASGGTSRRTRSGSSGAGS